MTLFYQIIGNKRPQFKDIDNFVVTKYAVNWKQLGRNLGIDDTLLSITEKDHPHDCETCCSKMLSEWLDVTPNASWKMLYNAMDKTKDDTHSVEKLVDNLSDAVTKLETAAIPNTINKLEQLGNAADVLPDTVDKLGTAANILPVTINKLEKLGTAADTLPNTIDKLDNAANTLPDTVEKLGSAVNMLPKTVDHLCEAVNKLPKPVDKLHIAEDVKQDDITGT